MGRGSGRSQASMDRVKTGVVGLDTMLNGGLLPARPYVISGPTGAADDFWLSTSSSKASDSRNPVFSSPSMSHDPRSKANMARSGGTWTAFKILDATPDIRRTNASGP